MRKAMHASFGLAFGGCLVLLLAACSDMADDCENRGDCEPFDGGGGSAGASGQAGTSGQGGTSGQAGGGGSAGDGGGCDTTKSPSEEACLVSNEYAIFVSPSGKDGAAGTKVDPLKSITQAASAAGGTKLVLVCNGTYDEQVKLTSGAKLFGGFDCTTWAYQSAARPSVEPSSEGYALSVESVSAAVTIDDIGFKAKDGAAAGASSIAAFVSQSANVTLTRVKLEAGKGAKGSDGVLVPFTFPATTGLNGNAATGTQGGAAKLYDQCPGGGTTTGGVGGSAPLQGGGPGLPDHGAGKGGNGIDCAAGGAGTNGNPAPVTPEAAGATSRGTLTSTGWTATGGTDGPHGAVGQGGGGGAADATGGSGSGAAGACGGAGGPGGGGGGASIALLVFESAAVSLVASELVAADAGDGGSGAAGQPGMTVGGNGGFQSALGGCPGGKGGGGAAGGAGGGGAGGISAGIAYASSTQTAPVVDGQTTFLLGKAGAAGVGGKPASNDGVAGVAENVFEVK
jgi:hypothetical protein